MSFIQLNRTFSDFLDSEVDEAKIQLHLFVEFHRNGVCWSDLLKSPYVVVLGEARIGKTTEFKEQAKFLNAIGITAFFVDIGTLVNDGIPEALRPEDEERLNNWKAGTNDVIFFLDSVDEARLKSRHALEAALRKLQWALQDHWSRVRLVISCRISDWLYKTDVLVIEDVLKLERTSESKDKESPKVRVVQMNSLNLDQVTCLAASFGVKDMEVFLSAIKEANAEIFLGRPGDVKWIVEYWLERHRLGTLTELIEHNLAQKLKEENPERTQSDPLSPEQAYDGVETLAAAVVLCKQPSILLPDPELEPNKTELALDPKNVLPAWSAREIQALLNRPIFDEATYGRARFYHRSVIEYLSAKWFEKRLKQGCPFNTITQMFFHEMQNYVIPVPSLKGVTSWLAGLHDDFRKKVLEIAPEIILLDGDPSKILVDERAQALRRLAERYNERKRIGLKFDEVELRRIAHPDLASTINELLIENRNNEDLRELFIRIAEVGKLNSCSNSILAIALNPQESEFVRIYAIHALGRIASPNELTQLADYACTTSGLSNDLIGALCESLFPRFLSVADCLSLIRQAKREVWNSRTILPVTLADHIVTECPNDGLIGFLSGFMTLATEPPLRNIGGEEIISERFWWISRAIVRIFVRILKTLQPNTFPVKSLEDSFLLLQHCHEYGTPYLPELKEVAQELRKHPKLRRQFHWTRVGIKRIQGKKPFFIPNDEGDLCSLRVDDLDWLIGDIKSETLFENRKQALDTALSIWRFNTESQNEIEKSIGEAVKDNAELRTVLQTELSHKRIRPSPDYDDQVLKQKIKQERKQKADKEAFRRELHENLDKIVKGESFPHLYRLFLFIAEHGNSGQHRWGQSQWKVLIPDLGQEVADAVREGFKKIWRLWMPPLPYQLADTTKTEYGIMVGLTGICIEANDGLIFSKLSHVEARTATHYALREMNGLPDWFPMLAEAHPNTVRDVLIEEFEAEFGFDSQRYSAKSVLPYIRSRPGKAADFCAPILLEFLEQREPTSIQALNDSLGVVLSTSQFDVNRITHLAESKAKVHLNDNIFNFCISWLAAWLHVDSEHAWDFVESFILGTKDCEKFITALCAILKEPFWNKQPLTVTDYARPKVLRRMIPVVYGYVRPQDDVWHEGTYSPDTRDYANGFRDQLLPILASLIGDASHKALIELANDHSMIDYRDWILNLLDQNMARAAEAKPWSPKDVVEFVEKFEKESSTASELFLIALSRFDDLRSHIEKGDFSERDLFKPDMPEAHIQKWLAARLHEKSAGKYTVHREEEVDLKKEPDIRLHHPKAGCVGIEVKPTDRYTYSELEAALTNQLQKQYLRAADSRHGILFLANLKIRSWELPNGSGKINFQDLIVKLNVLADKLVEANDQIDAIRVVGIDFTPPE